MLKIFVAAIWLLAGLLTSPVFATPITVQSVLFDSDGDVLTVGPLTEDPTGDPVTNGDFTIFRIPTAVDLTVGNGIDDRTRGVFDFRGDASYTAFSSLLSDPYGKVFAASLFLVLKPLSLFTNDQFNIENTAFVGDPEIGVQLTDNPFIENINGEETMFKLVTLDLLDYYSQVQLKNFLSGGTGDFISDGRIVMTYGDDAIVSGAALRLTANVVPEPSTFALLFLGLLSSLFTTRLKQK